MQFKNLQPKRILRSFLLILLLSRAGMTKAQTENITFVDDNVKAYCVANWDTNGDEELSYDEAAGVTSLDGVFMFDGDITSFDELQFFTGLTSLGEDEFNSCTNLAAITIPSAVTTIGSYAFSDCSSLTSITSYACAPPTLGSNVFDNVPSAVVLNVPCHTAALYQAAEGWSDFSNYEEFEYGLCPIVFADDNVKAICVAHWDTNGDDELSYSEAAAVTNLGTYFKSTSITSFDELEYFTSLTSLPNTAFYGCTSLTSIVLPSSISALGNGSFYNCTSLASMTVYAETPPTVGTNAFKNVPTTMVVHVLCEAYDAYHNANGWSELANIQGFGPMCPITFADANVKVLCVANWDTDNDGELSYAEAAAVTYLGEVFKSNNTITSFNELQYFTGLTSIGSYAFSNCSSLTSVELPNSVTSIGSRAFYYCTNLTSVEIPGAVTSINYDAFYNCTGLTSIEIPGGVTLISDHAFSNCSSLTSVEIPYSVTSIGSYAFYNCTSLTSVELPYSVTSIGTNPFSGCRGLEQIVVASDNAYYDSRENCNAIINTSTNALVTGCKNTVIPNTVTSIGHGAFYNCTGLTSVTIGNSINTIGGEAFYKCTGLTSVTIGNSVSTIGSSAFENCTVLTSVTIGNSVSTIGSSAFAYCNRLNSITVLAETPPSLYYQNYYNSLYSFFNVPQNIPVFVPCDALEDYQTASYWSDFTNFIGLCSGEVSVTVNPSEGGTVFGDGYYSSGEICVLTATPNEGFVFANWMENGRVISMDSVCSFYAHPTTIVANFCSHSPIVFADTTVKALCVANWDTNGDGELSYAEAAGVTSLGEVFRNDSLITSFSELQYFINLTTINSNAFRACRGLTSVTIGNSVSRIDSDAFSYCNRLNSMTVLAKTPPILPYYSPFINVPKDIPVYVPCDALEDYQEARGWRDFTNFIGLCSGEVSVTVNPSGGGTVTGAGFYTGGEVCVLTATTNEGFSFLNWMENGRVISTNSVCSFYAHPTTIVANFGSHSPIVFADTTVKALCVANWDTNGDGELSYFEAAKVTSLGEVFKNDSLITSFNEFQYFIGLTSIDEEAFSHCVNLTSIEIPFTVSYIGLDAFFYCSGLTSITVWADNPPFLQGLVPEEDIKDPWIGGGWVFDGADEAIPVYVPCNAVEAYQNDGEWSLFTNIIGMCSGDIAVTVNPSEGGTVTGAGYYDGGDLCVLTAIPNEGFSFANWMENGRIVSKDSVYSFRAHPTTIIANFCSHSPIVFEDTIVKALCVANWDTNGDGELSYAEAARVTDLGAVFKSNSSISSFNELQYFINLVSIDYETFSLCSSLSSIVIPNSVTSIKYRAFYGCSSLTSIEIPNSVTSIVSSAFYGCSGLEQIIVDSENTVYDSRGNSNAIIETETNKLVIGCKNTIIPNSVTSIDSYAFYGCSSLTSIEIPNAVTFIGYSAFSGCSNLTSMTVLADDPPTIYSTTFYYVNKGIPVYVPCGSTEAYQSAEYWNEFTNIQEVCTQPQIVMLSQGTNWFSTCLDISLDDLKAALVAALSGTNTPITIKSKTQNVKYQNGRWTGSLTTLDMTQMYKIIVSEACEISLEGTPVDPSTLTVTITPGANWIAFPYSENISVTDFFGSFPVTNDVVKSKLQNTRYNNGRWAGQLNTLIPGQGYIYNSAATGDRTFTFPTSAK